MGGRLHCSHWRIGTVGYECFSFVEQRERRNLRETMPNRGRLIEMLWATSLCVYEYCGEFNRMIIWILVCSKNTALAIAMNTTWMLLLCESTGYRARKEEGKRSFCASVWSIWNLNKDTGGSSSTRSLKVSRDLSVSLSLGGAWCIHKDSHSYDLYLSVCCWQLAL